METKILVRRKFISKKTPFQALYLIPVRMNSFLGPFKSYRIEDRVTYKRLDLEVVQDYHSKCNKTGFHKLKNKKK